MVFTIFNLSLFSQIIEHWHFLHNFRLIEPLPRPSVFQSVSLTVRQSDILTVRQSVSPSIGICNPFPNHPRVPGLSFNEIQLQLTRNLKKQEYIVNNHKGTNTVYFIKPVLPCRIPACLYVQLSHFLPIPAKSLLQPDSLITSIPA